MEKMEQLTNAYAVASAHVYEDIEKKVEAVSASLTSLVMAMRYYDSIFGKNIDGFTTFMRVTHEDASRVLESAAKCLTHARFFDLSNRKDEHWEEATATVRRHHQQSVQRYAPSSGTFGCLLRGYDGKRGQVGLLRGLHS